MQDESIIRLNMGGSEFVLLGTAHVSRESVQTVQQVILEEHPDQVCIEIDQSRYHSLTEKRSWQNLNIARVIREGKGFLLLSNLVLSSFQRRLGLDLGIMPGAEMLAAIKAAQEAGIPYRFCDRDIQITLKRAWAKSSLWGKNKLLAAMLGSIFSNEKLTAEDIEKLKTRNTLESMMEELADFLPSVKEVLIDERDRYLATRIYQASGREGNPANGRAMDQQADRDREAGRASGRGSGSKIVAVIGAGHLAGIAKTLKALDQKKVDPHLSVLEEIPPKGSISKIIPYLVPVLILGLFTAGFLRSGWDLSLAMMWKWVVVNGTLSALGALVALAHPLTILAAFLGAPITSMNPTIGVGLVTGILEAALRKPRVTDFENLPQDLLTLRGFFRNRITHILLVFFFSSLGSMLGTFVGIPYLTSLLR